MLDASLTADKLVLEGVVPTEAARDELVGRGEATFGRGQVVDHLEIAAGATAKGADLQTFGDALGALRLAGGAGAHLGWRDGRYVLAGPVADEAAKAAAGALAAKLLGNNATLTNALVSQAPSKPPPPPTQPVATPPVPTPESVALATRLDERPIVFALSSAVFTPASTATLDAAAAALLAQPTVRLQVNGHTDTSGTPSFNEWLGRLRAEAVVTALVERGVDPARLVPVSMGASAPSSPTDQAQNRRIVFVALA